MNFLARAEVRSYKASGIGDKMKVGIDKTGDNRFSTAVDNAGIFIL